MSLVPPTPPLVLELAERGCFAEFTAEGTVWSMDEGSALLRHYVHLLRQRTPESNDALVELHIAVGEAGLARHGPPPEEPVACKKGCSYCCHQHVSVSASEVFYVARKLRAHADLDYHVARLDTKLANTDWDPTRDFDIRNPCAFLGIGGACSIHVFRPMICRIIVSMDVGDCIRQLANGTGPTKHPRSILAMRGWLNPAMFSALQAAGLPVRDYELTGAVRAVLADPSLEQRWYAGEDTLIAFSSEDETPGDAMLAEIAHWRTMANV